MGWTTTHREPGISHLEWFRRHWGAKHADGSEKILDCAAVGWRTVYMAYRLETGKVIGLVCLIEWRKNEHYNFGYKDMSEDMGPCEAACPERILKLLSPIEEWLTSHKEERGEDGPFEWAQNWRQRCWERIEKRKRKLKVRDVILFKNPVRFTDGCTFDGLVVQSVQPFRLTTLQGYKTSYGRTYRYSRERLVENIAEVLTIEEWEARAEKLLNI